MSGVERTVKAVVTSYVHPDGAPRIALRGDVIDVHDHHVEAFDKGEAEVPEPRPDVIAAMEAEEPESEFDPDEPPRSGKGSGGEAWATYARQRGLAVAEGMSRDDIVALVNDK